MDYSQPFSVLNEKLRPQFTTSEQLHSSLSRAEDRKMDSLKIRYMSYGPTMLQTEPESKVSVTEPEVPDETKSNEDQDELVCPYQEDHSADLLFFDDTFHIGDLSLRDVYEDLNTDNSSTTPSEETDSSGELVSEGLRDSSKSVAGEGEVSFQRSYDRTLPDLIKSGRPLCRRRTLGHVSDTLKEVRREVELSRRRSIKIKAQVDRLQEGRDGLAWSQHRETVTEEVLSVLRLLHPLVEPDSSQPELSNGKKRLDDALAQLQNVACKLATSHTKQDSKSGGTGADDSAILQQALRDRDEAIEKKMAMEDEVLRSKMEMMTLNNQLLEAAQKRLELSLELEAWKEDFQRLLQQQLKAQQQAEQAQKKPSRMGILRRTNKAPIQRPGNFPLPTPPVTNSNQIFMTGSASSASPAPSTPTSSKASSSMWKMKLKKNRSSCVEYQDEAERESECRRDDDGFQVVSLD